jgi:hypothetical protein
MLAKTTIQSIGACCHDFETYIVAVQRWCPSRRLQLNPDKTELICFGSAKQPHCLRAANTSINSAGVDIRPIDSLHNLGVYKDRLDMRVHISKIASICFFHPRMLRHLRHTVDRDTRQRLVSALIPSRIDYSNALFAGLPCSSHISPVCAV